MHFSEPKVHMVPLVTSSKILPLNMLCVQTVCYIKQKESMNMRPGSLLLPIFIYERTLRDSIKSKIIFPALELTFGICDELCELPKRAFKNMSMTCSFLY